MRRALAVGMFAVTIAAGVLVLPAPAAAVPAAATPAAAPPAAAAATPAAAPPAAPATATTPAPSDDLSGLAVTRHGGADRYATSLLVAEAVADHAGGSVDTVVLVSGRSWPDAVVAAPLAGALSAPLLMTPPDQLRDDAAAFLTRVSAQHAVIVGTEDRPETVTPDVTAALEQLGISVERITGVDRYATGVAAARRLGPPGAMGELDSTAIVASGEVFADALVAGPFAVRGTHPVLLTDPAELHPAVAAFLGSENVTHVVLMGGTAAVSDEVEQSISEIGAGINVTRVAGTSRYDTAVKAAELVLDRYSTATNEPCFTTRRIGLARARVPFDSFSAGPLLARLCAPLLLADPASVPTETAAFLDTARTDAAAAATASVELRVFGGDAAVSQAALDAYLDPTADTTTATATEDAEEEDAEEEDAADTEDAEEDATTLPAGTCGGSIDDEPQQLTENEGSQDAAWSPDCSKIAYSRWGSLWTMNNDGSEQRVLVNYDGNFLEAPAWSPDGSQIAFSRGRRNDDGHWFSHIYLVNADGTGRTKFSKGDVRDERPAWSPSGDRIAFERSSGDGRNADGGFVNADRYIAVMNADRTNLTALMPGGGWDHAPAWSPSGDRIAYVSNNSVWLVDPDGTDATRIIAGVFWGGGLSWSPDGKRIAFARGDRSESSIIIARVDGLGEEVVTDPGSRNITPRWSPDGQRIAFTRLETDARYGPRRVYTTGASGSATATGTDCRPRGLTGTTAGFPLPPRAVPSTGTLRVAVLFMDFSDAQASHTTQEEAELGVPFIEAYLESVSYGLVDVELVPHHVWLRAAQPYSNYLGQTALGLSLSRPGSAHAVELADDDVDFSDIDIALAVFPSSHFGGGNAGGTTPADGVEVTTTRANTKKLPEPGAPQSWGSTGAHEIVHNLGLLDLYPYDTDAHPVPQARSGKHWVHVEWGLMGLKTWFPAESEDRRLRLDWSFPSGGSSTSYATYINPEEMLAWSRWQLGWLGESQVRCITAPEAEAAPEATVSLTPIAQPGDGIAMAAVQLNAREVIVIESRRQLGYNLPHDYVAPNGGRTTFPNLIGEGVLVYTVDALIGSGQLPVHVAGDSGNGQVDDYPLLTLGQSVTLRGYTITVIADNDDTHTVTITKTS